MSSLKLNNVNLVYPSGETGLYGVNLEANDKEFLVVVGGEKCGKSSLLRSVAGLEQVTEGEIFIDGKNVTEEEPKNRDIAMIFKSDSLYASLNVFDNMAFGLRIRKAPEALIQARVKVVAEMLGLTDVLFRKPKVLTAAAKQRVAIGRAIVREPKLYLFDDPLSGLDEKLRADMLNIIVNLQARLSGTFLYATKNLSEALTIGTRVVVMKNGFIQQIDTPQNLYDYPANTYVAFYIGSPTVNFIKKVKIVEENGAYYGVNGNFKLPIPENIVARFISIGEYANTDKYVTLGLRPEDLKVEKGGEIKAKVAKCEDENYVECDVTPDICLNVRGDKQYIKGEEVEIKADLSKLMIFDAKTCLTLLARDEGYVVTGLPNADYTPLPFDEEERIYNSLKPNKQTKKK